MSSSNLPFYRLCKSCSLLGTTQQNEPACKKFKIKVVPEEDYCSWHTMDSTHCVFCSNDQNLLIVQEGNDNYVVCPDHYAAFHSCQTCVRSNICGFKSDHSEPQIVMKTVRQGYMTMQTQVKNPNLIQKHCVKCGCYKNDTCLKDESGQSCPSWQLQKEMLQ